MSDHTTLTRIFERDNSHDLWVTDSLNDTKKIEIEAFIAGLSGASPAIVGEIRMFAGASPPSGWLLCDGSAVSRSVYADLFSVTGEAFGIGDGSTTFNLPDFQGRSPVGVGTGAGLSQRNLADFGGEESHTISEVEMPNHNGHLEWQSGVTDQFSKTGGPHTKVSWGGSMPHNTMHPFLCINFIICYEG